MLYCNSLLGCRRNDERKGAKQKPKANQGLRPLYRKEPGEF